MGKLAQILILLPGLIAGPACAFDLEAFTPRSIPVFETAPSGEPVPDRTGRAALKIPVLFIGDSHTAGTFGRTLDQLLRDEAGNVTTYGSCGSAPAWWFSGQPTTCGFFRRTADGQVFRATTHPTPIFTEELKKIRPGLVVVALGANMMSASDDHIRSTTGQMVKAIRDAGVDCVWIAPPDTRVKPKPVLENLARVLRETVSGDCSFIDSRAYTVYPPTGGDGLHYDAIGPAGREAAKAWANSVFSDILKAFPLDR